MCVCVCICMYIYIYIQLHAHIKAYMISAFMCAPTQIVFMVGLLR